MVMTVKRIIIEVPENTRWIGWTILTHYRGTDNAKQDCLWGEEIEDGMIVHPTPEYSTDREE